jgi:hypothetical protein
LRRRRPGKLREAAAAFYAKQEAAPANAFLAALAARGDNNVVEVWPENWPAYLLFTSLQTQWNVGMGGRAGLKYEALYPLLDRQTDAPEQWQQLFDDVRVMEYAALEQMAEDAAD